MKTKLPFLVSQCLKSLRSERRPFLFVSFASPSLATYLFPAQAWKQLIESHRLVVLKKKSWLSWAELRILFLRKGIRQRKSMKKEHGDVFFGMLCLCQNFEISQIKNHRWGTDEASSCLRWPLVDYVRCVCVCFSYGFLVHLSRLGCNHHKPYTILPVMFLAKKSHCE